MHDFDYAAALDPQRSVVVEACAGSGKTWLLVSRILRLLLAGAKPGEILAITFTRKAAQEMQARLTEWLRVLALGTDAQARDFLKQRALSADEVEACLPQARNLLEVVLKAEPALCIHTFHGWFLQLLQNAPLSGGSSANFSLHDQSAALLEEAWQSLAEELAGKPEDPVAASLAFLFSRYGLSSTRSLLFGFVNRRAEWWAYTAGQADTLNYALDSLRDEMGVDPDQDVLGELWQTEGLTQWLADYAALLGRNSPTDIKLADDLVSASLDEDRETRFEAVWKCCFILAGTRKNRKASKAQAERLGSHGEARLLELHELICDHFASARDSLKNQAAWRFNQAGLRCGEALLQRYQQLKEDRQLLDFGDIEWRAFQLLSHGAHAEYMQVRLDSRYRHILLDEFQDTNPLQWQVMEAWLASYGAAGAQPRVFLVGDQKQSIYRFRRAEALLFEQVSRQLVRDFGALRLVQNTSRRSAPVIIAAVNRVFDEHPDFPGYHPHDSHLAHLDGALQVLPLAQHGEPEAANAHGLSLRNPLCEARAESEDLRREQEASQLAAQIRKMVGSWRIADETRGERAADYRDIMLLVRSRAGLETYERALRIAGIPYLSSRQGGLLDTLECSDLTALLSFLVTPFADLRLAQILRSPLFSCRDEELLLLAQDNAPSPPNLSWWQRLCALPAPPPALALARQRLGRWFSLADRLPVHDLLDKIYFEGEVMQCYAAATPATIRRGVLANLHAFIELALNMDSGRYPSLARFIDEIAALKQAPDQESPDTATIGDGGNAVRILTVHGAKGLEAPIVWLLDANAADRNDKGYRVLLDWPPEDPAPTHFSLLSKKDELSRLQGQFVEKEKQLDQRENLNLLYVAMTRAKQVFIMSGCENSKAKESWYTLVQQKLADSGLAESLPCIAPVEQDLTEPQPSLPADAPPLPVPPTGSRKQDKLDDARVHGIRVHALLEWIQLGSTLESQRDSLQIRLECGESEFQSAWQEAEAVLSAPNLTRFFDPDQYVSAHNELAFMGSSGELRRIDRLVVFAHEVWVLDYKMSASDSNDLSMLATPYLGQMQVYREAMRTVFTDRPVKCLLIFSGGRVFEVA
ncbi:MAG: UvrD-helicase domain-containing protein [Sulfuricellaceae bacterium]|nr:UvrD-helicase domain-containing protein [Sulfuricellaceae bacterium]